MKWRTDKPTADIIVVFLKGSCYPQVLEYDKEKQFYLEEHNSPVNIQDIEKWADLEEDETVMDCDNLEEEIKRYNRELWDRDTTLSDVARYFAKWGAEHLKK